MPPMKWPVYGPGPLPNQGLWAWVWLWVRMGQCVLATSLSVAPPAFSTLCHSVTLVLEHGKGCILTSFAH